MNMANAARDLTPEEIDNLARLKKEDQARKEAALLAPKEEIKAVKPGQPLPSAYLMFFRHGVQVRCEKGFMHVGDIRSANKRAQEHCKIMGYTFIFVRPLIIDLDAEEARQLTGPAHVDHKPQEG